METERDFNRKCGIIDAGDISPTTISVANAAVSGAINSRQSSAVPGSMLLPNTSIAPHSFISSGQIMGQPITFPNQMKPSLYNTADILGFYAKLDHIIQFAITHMPQQFKTQMSVLDKVVWHCECNSKLHQISERYCTECNVFPGSQTAITFMLATE